MDSLTIVLNTSSNPRTSRVEAWCCQTDLTANNKRQQPKLTIYTREASNDKLTEPTCTRCFEAGSIGSMVEVPIPSGVMGLPRAAPYPGRTLQQSLSTVRPDL